MEEVTREITWNVLPWMNLLLYGGSFLAVAVAAWGWRGKGMSKWR